jgi:hypothetical protein
MLGIEINGEFLELNPGTKLELEQENPFLQFNGEIKGDFTLPFEVKASDRNLRLLQFSGVMQKRIDNTGIACIARDGNRQHSVGKIKIERPTIHRNNASKGKISCFYLSGVASFFQDINGLLLSQVDLGGDRNFTQPPLDFDGGVGTWWKHIHDVINAPVNGYDYAFFPVIDQAWTGDSTSTTEINRMVFSGGVPRFHKLSTDGHDANVIVPFPYLHYVMKKAVAHVGWTIDGAIFSDPDFLKITMVNFMGVDWAPFAPSIVQFQGKPLQYPVITINLQNHVPQYTISEFLIALQNRFGWYLDFDRKTKHIRVQQLGGVVSTGIKDFSAYASPVVTKDAEQQGKIYALKNQFAGEGANGQPDFSRLRMTGDVQKKADLATPSETFAGFTFLARQENNFYTCRQNFDTGAWEWALFACNIFDVLPPGNNEEITTRATTIGMEDAPQYGGMAPRYDMPGVWVGRNTTGNEFGIHLLMYHGIQPVPGGQGFPFATSTIYNLMGTQVSTWSVAFECKDINGNPVGLYDLQWKKLLLSLDHPEQLECALNLPLHEFLKLSFSDTLVIDGVKMYLSKIKSTVPYSGTILVEALRVN